MIKRSFYGFLILLVCHTGVHAADALDTVWGSLHAQTTVIPEGHTGFSSPYSGDHSLSASPSGGTSVTATIISTLRPWKNAEFVFDPELSAGGGFAGGPGIAGYPNGEVAHVGTRAPRIYMARLTFQQKVDIPVPMLLTVGKMSALDIFDTNTYSHDPRTQFMNWGLISNAAWDYPADSRGYTWGAVFEVAPDSWSFRAGSYLLTTEANGTHLETDLSVAHGEAVEAERRYAFYDEPGVIRALGFWNHANMGDYHSALAENPALPDIVGTRTRGNQKYGGGINWEQSITSDFGVFSRWGWNDGHTETWEYTEVDRTGSLGFSLKGTRWKRAKDTVGLAGVVNGLSNDHRRYLEAGGDGFILGDGQLNYGTEAIVETYYAWHMLAFATGTLDFQEIDHPGYNRDRGPVAVGSIRLHLEF